MENTENNRLLVKCDFATLKLVLLMGPAMEIRGNIHGFYFPNSSENDETIKGRVPEFVFIKDEYRISGNPEFDIVVPKRKTPINDLEKRVIASVLLPLTRTELIAFNKTVDPLYKHYSRDQKIKSKAFRESYFTSLTVDEVCQLLKAVLVEESTS